jgi:hypothetical protein
MDLMLAADVVLGRCIRDGRGSILSMPAAAELITS